VGGRAAGVWSGEKSGAVKLGYDMVVCGYAVHVSADEVDHSMPILFRGGCWPMVMPGRGGSRIQHLASRYNVEANRIGNSTRRRPISSKQSPSSIPSAMIAVYRAAYRKEASLRAGMRDWKYGY